MAKILSSSDLDLIFQNEIKSFLDQLHCNKISEQGINKITSANISLTDIPLTINIPEDNSIPSSASHKPITAVHVLHSFQDHRLSPVPHFPGKYQYYCHYALRIMKIPPLQIWSSFKKKDLKIILPIQPSCILLLVCTVWWLFWVFVQGLLFTCSSSPNDEWLVML